MISEEYLTINDKSRRKSIISFIKRKPNCTKEDVIRECDKEKEGSRMTTRKSIKQLEEEGIIQSKKEKNRPYKLTIKSENLLLIIPQDLDEIFGQFKLFVDKMKPLNKGEKSENHIYTDTDKKDKEENITQKDVMSLLQYDIIEIINDVYLFYFTVILPHKLDNNDQISRLYSIYFGKVSEMYSYISSDSLTNNQPFNLDSILQSILYKNYIKSKGQNLIEKVLDVKKICKIINMENNLNNLLNLLWKKNTESVILLYGSKDGSLTNLQSKKKEQIIEGDIIYDTTEVLERTHKLFEELIKDGALSKIDSLIP